VATFIKYEGKKGIRWTVRVRRNGKSFTETFPTKRMGQEWANKMEFPIQEEAHFPERSKPQYHTMGELIDLYFQRILPQRTPKTQKSQRIILSWWKRNLGDTSVTNITVRLLEDYKHILLAKPLAPSTVNLYLDTLSAPLTYATSDALGWLQFNPVLKVKKFPIHGRVPILSDQQIQTLLDWVEKYGVPHLAIFTRIALGTGGRTSEILNMKWKQVNFKRQTITYLKTKNKKDRTVPMDAGLVQVLKDYYRGQYCYDDDDPRAFDDKSEEYLFYNPKTGKPMYDISQSWKKATSKANLEGLHRHDLRHVFCTKMVEKANVDVLVLADLLGHSSPKMVMKYRHTGNHQYSHFVQQMADSIFKKEPDETNSRST